MNFLAESDSIPDDALTNLPSAVEEGSLEAANFKRSRKCLISAWPYNEDPQLMLILPDWIYVVAVDSVA